MAKPFGEGLKYFRLYTKLLENYKIEIMEEDHGDAGFTFVIKMWCYIYERGYYIELNDQTIDKICKKIIKKPVEEFNKLLKSAIRLKLFDRDLFKNFNILTSTGLQEEYLDIAKRWKRIKIIEDYLLKDVDIDQIHLFMCDRSNRILTEKPKKEIPGNTQPKKVPIQSKPNNGVIQPSTEFMRAPFFINDSKIPVEEIRRFCNLVYEDQNEIFKKNISKDWFDSFVDFNNIIDLEYPQIRNSEYQLNIEKYKKILTEKIEETETNPVELMEAVEKFAANRVNDSYVVYFKLKDYIKYVRENKAKKTTKNGKQKSASRGYTPTSYD